MALRRVFTCVLSSSRQPTTYFRVLPIESSRNAAHHLLGLRFCTQLSEHPIPVIKSSEKIAKDQMDASEVIKNFDEETKKKWKIIHLEFEIMQQTGHPRLPEHMTDALWLESLALPSASARKRYYRYVRKIEVTKLSKEEKKQNRLKKESEESKGYSKVEKNTIFLFIRKKTMNQFYYSRLSHAMMFGQPIIFDMDFENSMRKQDIIRMYEQFSMAYGANKTHPDPFHMVLCNNSANSQFQLCLENASTKDNEDYLYTNISQHYLDLYPREKLVYLTPDAPRMLTSFDHNAIYILGGLVDKVDSKPVTLAKAKREKLKMAKLPLDQYLKWSCGHKSLTLNQMLDILLEMKFSNNWTKALKHVPQRKLNYHLKR